VLSFDSAISKHPGHIYDVIVVGAGPGGATTATLVSRKGLRVLMLDKESFPRDKICGDAISGKSVDALKELGLIEHFQRDDCLGSWGVTFSSPAGDEVAIPFTKALDRPIAPGFVCARETFDDILVNLARAEGVEFRERVTVTALLRDGEKVVGVTVTESDGTSKDISAPLVIGADGAYSVVVRELGLDQLDEDHYVAGIRAYYKGVTGFHERNHIEIHFVEESIPGYFWIFPMADGISNIGVGMLSKAIKKKGVKLKPLLDVLVAHPRFQHRFKHATKLGNTKGWGLPLGSKPRQMAGDGWMLLGDAASLIDPFTGEGIGNAMVSGMHAAKWAHQAHENQLFDRSFLKTYEREVNELLKGEFRLSHAMQRLGNWKWLLNTVVRKAARSVEVADAISCMFDDLDEREKLVSPLFYLRLLFA